MKAGRGAQLEEKFQRYKSSSSLIIHASTIAINAVSMAVTSMFGRLYALPLFQGTRSKAVASHSAAIWSLRERTIYLALSDALTVRATRVACYRQSYAPPIKFPLWLVAFVLALGHSTRAIRASHT